MNPYSFKYRKLPFAFVIPAFIYCTHFSFAEPLYSYSISGKSELYNAITMPWNELTNVYCVRDGIIKNEKVKAISLLGFKLDYISFSIPDKMNTVVTAYFKDSENITTSVRDFTCPRSIAYIPIKEDVISDSRRSAITTSSRSRTLNEATIRTREKAKGFLFSR